MTFGLVMPRLYADIRRRAGIEEAELRELTAVSGRPILFERGRMFAPGWPEAYVDFDQVITASAMTALRRTEILMFDDPLPAAFAVQTADGIPLILISEGMLGLATLAGFHVAASDRALGAGDVRGQPAREDLYIQLVQAIAGRGSPCPDVMTAVSRRTYTDLTIHRETMTAFVLLHELGHIALGHLTGDPSGIMPGAPFFPDPGTPAHGMEIEADAFACDAFSNIYALHTASTFWSTYALVEAGRRVTTHRDAHLSRTHPLGVNRLHAIGRKIEQRSPPDKPVPMRGFQASMDRTAQLLAAPEQGGLHRIEIANADVSVHHEALVKRYLESFRAHA
jgi:hypothetical protein